ncbi:membrane protein YczE [Arthrobacter russicus]|jgi:uncharacterized membrane protein YczE|uniref:Membrane protein YczE n=1 Tax=Arthrobacter russicus TaxID=172040 RepID=A0ABU1J6S0_9MICC|nr:hypothetical protein [Arthrobacter russicus]MDR6267854.1 putative membrane protein YczE [Arthrobacter russicus]
MKTFLTTGNLPVRLVRLFLGLFAYGFAIALMIRANLGASPWDVFGQGLAHSTGLSFGICTILISAGVLLLWIPLRQWPGFGTLANALLIGIFADLSLAMLHQPQALWLQALMFLAGLVLLAFATALYVGARLGPGPRDGLMTGLVRRTGKPVWIIRTGIEVVVVAIGFLLGGVAGLGTLVFALGIGPVTQLAFRLLSVDLHAVRRPVAALSGRAGAAPVGRSASAAAGKLKS